MLVVFAVILEGITAVTDTRPSTALRFIDDTILYRVLAYNLSEPTGAVLPANHGILTSDLEFNYLVENSLAVITDSGGITEETTVMGIPCMTLRNNTERPETVKIGSNELIGTDPRAIKPAMEKLFSGNWKKGSIPELWDGKTSERIVNHLLQILVN